MALFDNCVAAWKLSDLTDATGRGNTLTNNGGTTFIAGKIGNCAHFVTSSSQALNKLTSADVEVNGAGGALWEIGLWVKLADKVSTYWFIAKDDAGAGEYNIQYDQTADRFQATTYRSGGIASVAVANNFGSPTAGVWYCINAWYDGTDFRIAINDGTPDVQVGVATDPSTAAGFNIGKLNQFGGVYTNADIDAVHIWKGRVLTSGNRTEFYNAGTGIEFSAGGGATQMPYYGGGHSPYRVIRRHSSY